jgi:hypothetical protein
MFSACVVKFLCMKHQITCNYSTASPPTEVQLFQTRGRRSGVATENSNRFHEKQYTYVISQHRCWNLRLQPNICKAQKRMNKCTSLQMTRLRGGIPLAGTAARSKLLNLILFKHNQQDATLYYDIYYYKCSTCFRRFLRPSSGAQKLYTQHRVFVELLLLLTAIVSELAQEPPETCRAFIVINIIV